MKLPKVYYIYLGKDKFAAEYCDYGAMTGHFGIKPFITVNFSHVKISWIDIPYCLMHEMVHFFNRPLPRWLERLIDISWDVTLGRHEYSKVFDLYKIFEKEL